MNSGLRLKVSFIFFLVVFSVFALLPSITKDLPSWWTQYLAPSGLRLGLDLQGGLHIVLRADLNKAVENSLDLSAQDFTNALADQKINAVRMDSGNPNQVLFTLPNVGAVDTVKQILNDKFPDLDSQVSAEAGSFPRVILQLKSSEVDFIKKNAVNQSLEIIRNRIDQFGVAEPIVLRQGEDQIVVQLPGVQDPERAMELIGKTAQLEFKLVALAPGLDLPALIDEAIKSGRWNDKESRQRLNEALKGLIPEGTEVYFEKTVDKQTKRESKVPMLLEKPVLMTGEMIKNAQVRVGGTFNEPLVSLDLTSRGGQVFAVITEKNINRQLAIVLDENVRSAPNINDKITGGSAQITGQFTHAEASDLAIVLRVGALPAPVDIVQNLTVGAGLGQDSINQGLFSGLIGSIFVVLFMLVYYRLSGLIANISLALNILLLFVGLAMLGATLTLPGIAGIILSIGMAVDANILIYERMRDEFAQGKSLRLGVNAGFDKAYWSIVDGQVTTLITALVLFLFGTGPIKGFAITLTLGIIFNLFAVLFGSRLMYDILLSTRRLKPLKFLSLIGKTNFDFMGIRKFAYTASIIFTLLGLVAFVQIIRGHANMGVDFTGGVLLQYQAQAPFSLDTIRSGLRDADISGIDLQEVTGTNQLIAKVKQEQDKVDNLSDRITKILITSQPDADFSLESKSEIGASISADLRGKAIVSVLMSLVGVLIYLAIRFDFRFGMAAAVSTFHDILAVLGVCWLMDKEITLLIITALLTLAGFSLNDTVVIFDRIRENTNKDPQLSLHEIINNSINQVLARSFITALTILFTLVSLYFFGGITLHDFSFALLIGLVFGFFSSVFVAAPLLTVRWGRKHA